MADNHFDLVLVWDNLGGAVRINRGGRATVTDPATGALVTVVQDGQSVTTVTADENGRVSFVAQQGQVKLLMDGLAATYISAEQAVAGAANAAAAQSAQVAAESARDAAQTARDDAVAATSGKVDKGTLAITVKDYGAVGDGVTDDTAAIQSALTAARAAKARLLFEYGKTYIVSGTLNPLGVRVEGFGATLRTQAGVTQTWNSFQSSGACTITDLTIDLNKANTSAPASDTQGVGIYIATTSAGYSGVTVLRNVRVINGHQVGIRVSSSTSVTDASTLTAWASAVIDGCYVDSCKWGVWVKGVWGVTLRDVQVTSCTADGIYDYASRGTQVIGGRTSGNGGHGFVSQYGYETNVLGLGATGNTGSGITFGGGSTTITEGRRFTITGCRANNNGVHGIDLDPTKSGAGATPVAVFATVASNVANSNASHGIYLNNAKAVAVSGNACHNNTAGAGIAVAGHSVAVSGNTCTGNLRGVALYGNASFPNYGAHRIGMNVVSGNSSSTYYVESASVTGLQFAAYSATAPE